MKNNRVRYQIQIECDQERPLRASLGGTVVKTRTPNAGGLGSIPGQGTRSHMHAASKSSHATTKEPVSHN